MKKLLALLLAIVMIFALCACGSNDDDDEDDGDKKGSQTQDDDGDKTSDDDEDEDEGIIGTWVGEADLADMLNEYYESMELDDEIYDMIAADELCLTVTFAFEDEETIILSLEAEDAFEEYFDDVIDNMTDYFEEALEDEGYTVDEFEEESGMTLKSYVESQVSDLIGSFSFKDSEHETTYEFDGKEVSWDDSSMEIDLKGNKFTIEDVNDNSVDFLIGVTFKRK